MPMVTYRSRLTRVAEMKKFELTPAQGVALVKKCKAVLKSANEEQYRTAQAYVYLAIRQLSKQSSYNPVNSFACMYSDMQSILVTWRRGA